MTAIYTTESIVKQQSSLVRSDELHGESNPDWKACPLTRAGRYFSPSMAVSRLVATASHMPRRRQLFGFCRLILPSQARSPGVGTATMALIRQLYRVFYCYGGGGGGGGGKSASASIIACSVATCGDVFAVLDMSSMPSSCLKQSRTRRPDQRECSGSH